MSATNNITDAVTDNGKFVAVQTDEGFLNAVDYRTGMLSDAYLQQMTQESIATIQVAGNQSMTVESSSGKVSVQADTTGDGNYETIVSKTGIPKQKVQIF